MREATMNPERLFIFGEIDGERIIQEAHWPAEHDANHDEMTWLAILSVQMGKLAQHALQAQTFRKLASSGLAREAHADWRSRLIDLAAVCVAAVEADDRRKLGH